MAYTRVNVAALLKYIDKFDQFRQLNYGWLYFFLKLIRYGDI